MTVLRRKGRRIIVPNLAVVDMTGKEVGTVELSEAIFGIEPNEPAMHRMVA